MTERTGTTYEQLTGQLMLELEQGDAVETVEITRRKILQGRTTSHEIDVWWMFEWQGRRFTVAFQCKDWARSVEQGELLKFQAVLTDLATHDPYGVFVTRTGYQSGSLSVAGGNRISILELREPGEQDWAGRVRRVEITLRAVVPTWRAFRLHRPSDAPEPGADSVAGMDDNLTVHEPGKLPASLLKTQERLSPVGFDTADWQPLSVAFPRSLARQQEGSGIMSATGRTVRRRPAGRDRDEGHHRRLRRCEACAHERAHRHGRPIRPGRETPSGRRRACSA